MSLQTTDAPMVVEKRRRSAFLSRYFYWPLEAAAVRIGVFVVRLIPVDVASTLGGTVARLIGPRTRFNLRALAGLKIAFPEASEAERKAIALAMWDNLGRVAAEYVHLDRITDPKAGRVEVIGAEHILALAEGERAGILASGHLGNWEILPVMAGRIGVELTGVAREPNNPLVRPILARLRGVAGGRLINKGPEGAKQAIAALRDKQVLAMLVDQKMNDGIPIPFFGHDAMTAAAPAQLALRFDCPLVPVRVERLEGARFRITCYPPLRPEESGDRSADTAALMGDFYRLLEGWIAERPQQWLWLHRRWPKAIYQQLV